MKWEYDTFSKNINIDGKETKNIKGFLNKLGEQGWEVIKDSTQADVEKKHIIYSVLCKKQKSNIIKP